MFLKSGCTVGMRYCPHRCKQLDAAVPHFPRAFAGLKPVRMPWMHRLPFAEFLVRTIAAVFSAVCR